jgi:hypothetical protein
MQSNASPFDATPPSPQKLLVTCVLAMVAAAAVLVFIVLPAEYAIDPTGIGRTLGLTQMTSNELPIDDVIADVIGGNDSLGEAEIPDFGQPLPLPNPAIFQREEGPEKVKSISVTIPPGKGTEIKALLGQAKVITYSWRTEQGDVYVDFHGHDPSKGDEFWVRYEELQAGSQSSGSLVAPFAGEHGWYWLNTNDFPVTISLTINGYFDDTKDYGIFE